MTRTPAAVMEEELKPCPFCRSADVAMLASNGVPHGQVGAGGTRHVECNDCYATGPAEPSPIDGRAWNHRTPAEPLADGEMIERNRIAIRNVGAFIVFAADKMGLQQIEDLRIVHGLAESAYNPNERLAENDPATHGYYLGKTGDEMPGSEGIVELVSDLRCPWQRFPHSERERIAEILIALNNRAYANDRLREALEAIVDRASERDIKWTGMTARDIALARSNRDAIRAELETQVVECERFTLISGSKAAQRFRELLDRLPSLPDTGE